MARIASWIWVHCTDYLCGHCRAVALSPWAILLGLDNPAGNRGAEFIDATIESPLLARMLKCFGGASWCTLENRALRFSELHATRFSPCCSDERHLVWTLTPTSFGSFHFRSDEKFAFNSPNGRKLWPCRPQKSQGSFS